MSNLLSTKPYKGTRDFFPEEMRFRTAMFETLAKTVESFGYEKIDAPLIEPLDIYLAKTSEEIVNQQIYSFVDRGERKVAIRPEMTPTVSRMVAQKIRELPKPVRWYSIPNLWRYEQPGKGRLREHWQLNCDLFGAANEQLADLEILQLACEIPIAFGANHNDFSVQVNNRRILNSIFEKKLNLSEEKWPDVARILDKRLKIAETEFEQMLASADLSASSIELLQDYLQNGTDFLQKNDDIDGVPELLSLLHNLEKSGYQNFVQYAPGIVRGFDYYTGLVFEVFDQNPENRRSLFGGGRYNNLIGNFSKDSLNAVGFGMGDVTFAEFLKLHDLLKTPARQLHAYIAMFEGEELNAIQLATRLRKSGLNIETSAGAIKLGKQFQEAETKGYNFVILQGSTEANNNVVQLKNLSTGDQKSVSEAELLTIFKNA
ncbi:MAG: histidine--tRNA ligase [Leptospiraceae bacterium]|nr:histidine--tRNA ligase [Leptospiraceae bacterium]